MSRSARVLTSLQALALVAGVTAATAGPAGPRVAPPAGAISSNVEFIANIPQAKSAISLNFI
ncbi:MAG: hypothetical protein QOF18_2948, partial [Frankiaceae bacterium]|nr:hypothetical protein [Frankiaceae bacterium]